MSLKIIKIFDPSRPTPTDKVLLQSCLKGKCTDWKRKVLLRNLINGKIAVISLNLFERIACFLKKIFCAQDYSKFETVFKTKKVELIPPFDLKQTEIKTSSQAKSSISNKDSKTKEDEKDLLQKNQKKKDLSQQQPVVATQVAPASVVFPQKNNGKLTSKPETPTAAVAEGTENSTTDAKPVTQPETLTAPISEGAENSKIEGQAQPETSKDGMMITQAQKVFNFIVAGNLEEAVKASETLTSEEQDGYFCDISKAYFKQCNFEKANEILKRVSNFSISNPIFVEFAQSFWDQNNHEQAFKILNDNVIKTENIDQIYKEFATPYFEKGNLEIGFKILDNYVRVPETRSQYYKEFALSLCEKGKYKDSKDCFEKLPVQEAEKLAAETFLNVAEEHCKNNRFDEALETVAQFKSLLISGSNSFYFKIANGYFLQNQSEKALKTLEKIRHSKSQSAGVKELYIKIAEKYKDQMETTKALTILRILENHASIINAENAFEIFDFLSNDDYDNALKAMRDPSFNKKD